MQRRGNKMRLCRLYTKLVANLCHSLSTGYQSTSRACWSRSLPPMELGRLSCRQRITFNDVFPSYTMKMAVHSSDSIMQDTTMFTGIFTGMEHVIHALGHLSWHKKFTSLLVFWKKRRNFWLGNYRKYTQIPSPVLAWSVLCVSCVLRP